VRVIHGIEIRSLPNAPEAISGIINISGRIIPVVDIRKRLGLQTHEMDPDDMLIIAMTGKREIAIHVDTVTEVKDLMLWQFSGNESVIPYSEYFSGVAKINDDLVLIHDLERFLSLNEEKELEHALNLKTDEA
jgi:purine-binding chemotaxis protein CheW